MNSFYESDDILKWITSKLIFIEEYGDRITEINIYNKSVSEFGRNYNRVFFKISTNARLIVKPETELTKKEKKENYIATFHVSFPNYYSLNKGRISDEDASIHYEWIVSVVLYFWPKKMQKDTLKIADFDG